jgi:hypothetical protein
MQPSKSALEDSEDVIFITLTAAVVKPNPKPNPATKRRYEEDSSDSISSVQHSTAKRKPRSGAGDEVGTYEISTMNAHLTRRPPPHPWFLQMIQSPRNKCKQPHKVDKGNGKGKQRHRRFKWSISADASLKEAVKSKDAVSGTGRYQWTIIAQRVSKKLGREVNKDQVKERAKKIIKKNVIS